MQKKSNSPNHTGTGNFFGSILVGITFGVIALALWTAKFLSNLGPRGNGLRIGEIICVSSSIATVLGCLILGTGSATILKHMPKEALVPVGIELRKPDKKPTWWGRYR